MRGAQETHGECVVRLAEAAEEAHAIVCDNCGAPLLGDVEGGLDDKGEGDEILVMGHGRSGTRGIMRSLFVSKYLEGHSGT